jgi:hypothetical protein
MSGDPLKLICSVAVACCGAGRSAGAAALLDRFAAEGIVVEVTHREKRRLFGLAALAPLREAVVPPRRPEPGRGRGRPPIPVDEPPPAPLPPAGPLSRVERQAFDYAELESWMAHADQAIRQARRVLDTLARPAPTSTLLVVVAEDQSPPARGA